MCCAHIGVSSVEIKTEADHNDLTECSHDDKPSTGMFAVFFVCIFCVYCLLLLMASEKKLHEYSLYLFLYFGAKERQICG